jgi:hypothetical protein
MNITTIVPPTRLVIPKVTGGNTVTEATHNGSEQIVEPDVVFIPGGFGDSGHKFWMVATPYPSGFATYENPCIFCSDDPVTWTEPGGPGNNPIEPAPKLDGINNDPCIVFKNGTLFIYYLVSFKCVPGDPGKNSYVTALFMKKSEDGLNWSDPARPLLIEPTDARLMSPSVFWDGTRCFLYYVNWDWNEDDSQDRSVYRRESADGIDWSSSQAVAVTGLPHGIYPWHLNVRKDHNGSRLHMLLAADSQRGGGSCELYYGYSDDHGITFAIVDHPLLPPREDWESDQRYRAGFVQDVPDPSLFHVWYSARHRRATDGVDDWDEAYACVRIE